MIGRGVERLAADMRLGWSAPVGDLVTGMFAALAVTLTVILGLVAVLFLADGTVVMAAVIAAVAPVQLGATFALAGRQVRHRHDT